MTKIPAILLAILIGVTFHAVYAEDIHITSEDYINTSFLNEPPKASVLWIKGDVKTEISKILEHPYHKLRVKYWEKAGKTVWILDEIGKEKYITTGITINKQAQIEDIKVLSFRESRGWEVKHDFFTQQFKNIFKLPNTQLSEPIDGITGATLSVNALKKQARMALYLHEITQEKKVK